MPDADEQGAGREVGGLRARCDFSHPLMETRPKCAERVVIVVGTDKGLCGAAQQQPDARSGERFDKATTDGVYITAGTKGVFAVHRPTKH